MRALGHDLNPSARQYSMFTTFGGRDLIGRDKVLGKVDGRHIYTGYGSGVQSPSSSAASPISPMIAKLFTVLLAATAVSSKLTWADTKFLFSFGDSYTADGYNVSAGINSVVPGPVSSTSPLLWARLAYYFRLAGKKLGPVPE